MAGLCCRLQLQPVEAVTLSNKWAREEQQVLDAVTQNWGRHKKMPRAPPSGIAVDHNPVCPHLHPHPLHSLFALIASLTFISSCRLGSLQHSRKSTASL